MAYSTMSNVSMANGNRQTLLSVRDSIRAGHSIDIDTRDDLLFTAIIDVYDQLEKFTEKIGPAIIFYRVGIFFASALGLTIMGFLWGLLTGQIEILTK